MEVIPFVIQGLQRKYTYLYHTKESLDLVSYREVSENVGISWVLLIISK